MIIDPLPSASMVRKGGRNAPTVWNVAFHSVQFWDGRAATLEDQAKGPPVNPIEMGMPDLEAAVARLRAIPGYQPYFEQAFGQGDTVTGDNAAKAVAAYERTLITPNSPYDRYVKGDKKALTREQVRGMNTFAETHKNRGQNTVFANILITIRDNKPHGSDKCRANQDLSYLEFRNMLYNGVIIASLVFTPKRIIGDTCMI
jgi:hypothetical protein